jgi:hypothetical protein
MKEFIRVGGDLGNNYVQVQASESDDGRKQKRRFRIRVGTHNLRQPFQRAAPAGTFGWLCPVRGPKPPADAAASRICPSSPMAMARMRCALLGSAPPPPVAANTSDLGG